MLSNFFKTIFNANFSDGVAQLSNCDVIFFCHDVDRSVQLDGKAYSPLVDSVRRDFEFRGFSCISIAHPWSSLIGQKGYGNPVGMNRKFLKYILIRKIFRMIGVTKDLKNNPYGEILRLTKAKLIITIGSPQELALTAREMGVFHVELLHGIGYTFLEWGWGDLPVSQLPQGVLCLDNVSYRSFSLLKEKGVEIFTIPHPFLRLFSNKHNSSLPAEWVYKPDNEFEYSKHILISLTWGYAGDHGLHTQFANILQNGLFYDELAELIAEETDIFWHFRLHPVQLRSPQYKFLIDFIEDFVSVHPNTEWRQSSELPFPSVVKLCDGCILMSSMSCYDAALMGVQSLMLCPTVQPGGFQHDFGSDLLDEGYLLKQKICKESIRNWIHSVKNIKPRLDNLHNDEEWSAAVSWMIKKSGLEALNSKNLSNDGFIL